jgi:5-deoxy-5-amino-3-dehydroquinate synthase
VTTSVTVALGVRKYEVVIGRGVLDRLAKMVPPTARQAAVVTQGAVGCSIDVGGPSDTFLLPDGEGAKTLASVEELCRSFARAGLGRGDVVVAVGGGVVTDVAGFAAASYLRGVALVNVPTTLVGQVDAAIGGKTAVNLPEGKNLVGAFWQPRAVLCDLQTLDTLPRREWASGHGEVAKCAFLAPRPGEPAPGNELTQWGLDEQVEWCVALKAAVVSADEREGGRRMLLNYGHTLAHALEAVGLAGGPVDLRHGEAVAVGLVFAARLSERLGRIDEDRVAEHLSVLAHFGLPTELPGRLRAAELLEYMARDKKALHDLTFVLDGPGGVEPVRGVEEKDVVATLAAMGAEP